jgi:hypothetical protein
MLFGVDCVLLSKKDYSKLSSYHKSYLKMIMNLSERTADAAMYILSGELPLESFIHSQILLKLCYIRIITLGFIPLYPCIPVPISAYVVLRASLILFSIRSCPRSFLSIPMWV